MAKIEVKTEEEFLKALVFPAEYKYREHPNSLLHDFLHAKKRLEHFKDGKFFVTNNPYEWFLFEISNKVRILFYPHTKSTGNVSTRARNQSSKDIELYKNVEDSLTELRLDEKLNGSSICHGFHFKNK